VVVTVARERLARRLERRRVGAVDHVDLRAIEHRNRPEENTTLFLATGVGLDARLDGHRREDPDRLLALADLIPKLDPGAEAADIAGVRPGDRDQQLVVDRVLGQPVA